MPSGALCAINARDNTQKFMSEPVHVLVSNESGFAQKIVIGRHTLAADEPAPIGTDTGPSPYELLLSSLGSCKSMTVRAYAEQKGWDVGPIVVRLRHFRIHA